MAKTKEPRVVNIHEAKTHLSRLIARVEKGEEIVLAKAGKPCARLVPVEPRKPNRQPGLLRGMFSAEGILDDLSEEELREFEESDDDEELLS